jgi:hypothetical protein
MDAARASVRRNPSHYRGLSPKVMALEDGWREKHGYLNVGG